MHLHHLPPRFTAEQVRLFPPGLPGLLRVPPNACAMVAFAHGSGSGRLSPRNNQVAEALGTSGIATLLFDLLTNKEAADRRNVFDIALLAQRLGQAIDWLGRREDVGQLPFGLFGASTGAAAALVAAAASDRVAAVVSRGGRPDLAAEALPRVRAPTLLIVGGLDTDVLELNRQAQARMRCETSLEVVPGATHLFEEPGALQAVVELSRDWFKMHLR
ncbi:MAG: alpha/beta family hydrolase [Rhodanobacter sp.]|jgi:dienelactone hydrolase